MQTSCLWLFRIGFFCNSIQTVPLDSAGTALYFVDNKDHLNLPVCSAAKATHSKLTEEITSAETQTCCRHLVVFLSHFVVFSRDKVSLCLFCIFLRVFGFFPVHVVPGGATRRSARTQLQRPENKESVRIAGDRPWSQRQRHTGLLRVCLKLPKNHIQAEKMTTRHSCSLKRFLYKFKCNFIITQMWLIAESE